MKSTVTLTQPTLGASKYPDAISKTIDTWTGAPHLHAFTLFPFLTSTLLFKVGSFAFQKQASLPIDPFKTFQATHTLYTSLPGSHSAF